MMSRPAQVNTVRDFQSTNDNAVQVFFIYYYYYSFLNNMKSIGRKKNDSYGIRTVPRKQKKKTFVAKKN